MNIFQAPNWLKVLSNSYISSLSPLKKKNSVCVQVKSLDRKLDDEIQWNEQAL